MRTSLLLSACVVGTSRVVESASRHALSSLVIGWARASGSQQAKRGRRRDRACAKKNLHLFCHKRGEEVRAVLPPLPWVVCFLSFFREARRMEVG